MKLNGRTASWRGSVLLKANSAVNNHGTKSDRFFRLVL
eukprot:CAMPEP_0184686542 /NCGR_PEP_ID=MMETSP0312-20130426/22880_1 /TAXON_ID=31354 /ORGANISM="Compsopogon coeruleus, Strain SAG 36.94" /LENGTH=37 /DNA_ID= /DNA_START= /DNA_END= /DNA_ORIENTATION=